MKSAVLQLSQVALYFVSSQSHVFLGHFSSFTWKLRSIRIKIFKHTKHDMFKQKWNLRYSNLKRNSCLMHVMSQSCSSFTQSHNILLVKIRKRSNTSLRVSARRPRSVITASRSTKVHTPRADLKNSSAVWWFKRFHNYQQLLITKKTRKSYEKVAEKNA